MLAQAGALIWAQWRVLWNAAPRTDWGGAAFAAAGTLLWYGGWSVVAGGAYLWLSDGEAIAQLPHLLPAGLLLLFLYWQVVPVALASAGFTLDTRRLRVYPVPHGRLFAFDVMLRLSVVLETLLVLAGAAAGILANPSLPAWAVLGLAPFAAMNMLLSVGVRDMLGRLLARKRVREITVLLIVLLAALPQLLVHSGMPGPLRTAFGLSVSPFTPWGAAGNVIRGSGSALPWLALCGWAAAAWVFARWQFERSLRFDEQAAQSSSAAGWSIDAEPFFRWPRALFRDPLGALVEKEIRFLARAPRFRLVFLMGFSFGLLIWLPMAFGAARAEGAFAQRYLVLVSVYALMLLGEVAFYNSFGFDRWAAQFYFVAPVRISTVLAAKNIAALFFLAAEIAIITAVCAALRLPVTPAKLLEAYLVTFTLALFMLGVGNLGSTRHPKPVDPGQSWRKGGAGRFQATLLLIYPLISVPVALAYLARFAFDTELAFYLVMAFAVALAGVFYAIATESAAAAAENGKERMLEALSAGGGPVAG